MKTIMQVRELIPVARTEPASSEGSAERSVNKDG